MCGICGVVNYRDGQQPDPGVVSGMLDLIRHRGPDDEGIWSDAGVGLGMRRLSIIDLATGKQPMMNEDGSIAVVFNGEIYNYRELRAELQSAGHVLATASDTEVIVHLYEDYGDECVQHLRGMFAFALHDRRNARVLIARDRLGIKPMYFTDLGETLVFASEIKAILHHPEVAVEPDSDALSAFLSLKYVPAPMTMFRRIQALPPGHLMTCDASGVHMRPYWDLSYAHQHNRRMGEQEYAEQLEKILREVVGSHLVSDVPFGAFLSGGVDSSTVVALMSQVLGTRVRTFSVGFSEDPVGASELPYARLVAERYETEHHEIIIRPQDVTELAEKLIWHIDQPIADEAVLPNYMVSALAARHVKMVLTGEGGDELFAGYARYAGEKLAPVFNAFSPFAKKLALSLSSRLPGLRRPKLALYALAQPSEVARFANWFPLFNSDMKAELLGRDRDHAAERAFAQQLEHADGADALSRMLYVDTKLWLADDLLARGDKTSMAASIEARVPLLDHKLVEFAASLPSEMKLHGFVRKYLLKKVASKWLPAEIIARKKQGFPTPMSAWFRGPLRCYVRDMLCDESLGRRGLFDSHAVRKLLDEHETGKGDHSSLIWGLLNVELWHRVFLDRASQRSNVAPAAA